MKLKSVVAGQFYPDNRQELLLQFKDFEKINSVVLKQSVEALLLPHAGYVYSGSVAALGYRSLSQAPSTVIVIGPSHYVPFKGVSLYSGDAAETPFGDLAVDRQARDFLMDFDDHIADIPLALAKEHSVEVHFPMIKHYFPSAEVVPIVMGQGVESSVRPLTEALLGLRKQKSFLLVASSDLSHYPLYETAVKADKAFLEALLSGHEAEVVETDKKIIAKKYPNYYCTHCGKEPVSTLLRYTQAIGTREIQLLAYQNSGDVTGDHSRVVGYSAVAFSKNKK
jgi:AmmeMemoRadiSam system protein B